MRILCALQYLGVKWCGRITVTAGFRFNASGVNFVDLFQQILSWHS
jgi:hypothetical protein